MCSLVLFFINIIFRCVGGMKFARSASKSKRFTFIYLCFGFVIIKKCFKTCWAIPIFATWMVWRFCAKNDKVEIITVNLII